MTTFANLLLAPIPNTLYIRTPVLRGSTWGAILGLMLCTAAQAQPYWVRHVGSLGNDQVSDVKVDEAGDIYITGEFSGDADFADSTFSATGGIDLFVAKVSADGEVIWWKQGGGYGIDRGIKLAFGPNNTLAVVGEFMGQADFQGVTITSQGFTPDMFCAVLDRATGTQQWIRHGGGSAGADRPYGVTVSSTGQVTMAGEFKGAASWDGFNLVSTPDEETAEPTMDVVIVSYSASGTALWVQQGAADRTDRAIDVVNDPLGNIYVTGQFSDTITFDVEHLNAMYNSSFLLKLDAAGNEVWFRRCGGAIYDQVRDLLFTPDGQLLLTGDLQGTMIFLDDVPDFISGEQDYNYYLLRVSTDGQLLAQGQLGSENGVSARGIDLRNDTIAVVGQFNCQFTSLSSHYGGTGLFLAAGEQDLFVTKHRYTDLGFIEARHYGGPGVKLAGQVATLPGGDVVVCGSYTRSISFATTSDNPIDVDVFEDATGTNQPSPPSSCPDLDNTGFESQAATGSKDGLLARAYVRDSVVYDWWTQQAGVCDHPATWGMCVGMGSQLSPCPDTLVVCGGVDISANLPFLPSFEENNSVGPLVEVTWNNGDSTLISHITTTGAYSVQVDAVNGCWSWSDGIYVVVHPMPPKPRISDDIPQNVDTEHPGLIYLCDPDSVLLWCTNIDTTTTYGWSWLAGGQPVQSSTTASVVADTTGTWEFAMTTDAGCTQYTALAVVDQATPNLDSLGLDAEIIFLGDSVADDSISLCAGEPAQYEVVLQWYWNGVPILFPQDLILQASLNGGLYITQLQPDGWIGFFDAAESGWYDIHLDLLVLNGACGGDSLHFEVEGEVWVDAWPESVLSISLTGASTMCVGDSTLLTADCPDCEAFSWAGEGLSGANGSTAWATIAGTYSVHGTAIDEHGCPYDGTATHVLSSPAAPALSIDPADGIICPFDSALIFTDTPGTDQVWYGPYGPVPNNSQQLWTDIPGEYYLEMTDLLGCHVTSDPALITGYSTPFLNVIPDDVLCFNEEETLLQIQTTAPSTIVWAPPFSGSSLQQTVTEPGIYSVSSTACGITTEMSVTVVASDVLAEVVETGPFDLCFGGVVVLHAAPGQAVYIWQPGNVFSDSLVVTEAGEYVLQVVDGNGCADTSDVIVVIPSTIAEPLVATGDTICVGETATLTAVGSGTINWYSDASVQDPVFSGSPITLEGLVDDTTFFVMQSEGPCTSAVQAAVVVVDPLPGGGTIDAPSVVCGDVDAVITFIGAPGVNAQWTTPNGTITGTQIIIADFSAGDSGLYIAYPFIGGCYGDPISASIGFATPVPFSLGPDTTYCIGGWYTLTIPGMYTGPVWSTGTEGYAIQVISDGYYTAFAVDTNGCPVQDVAYLSGIDCGPIIPNVITPNGDGDNDVLVIEGSDGFMLAIRIYNRWGQEVWEASGQDIRWNGYHMNGTALVDGVYYYELLRTGLTISQAYTGYVHIMRGK